MPLDASKHYADSTGARIQLKALGPIIPNGICLAGQPTADPKAPWKLYAGDGQCQDGNHLVREWPADDADTYYPLIRRADDTFRPIATAYAEIPALKREWAEKVDYALHIGKDGDVPTARIYRL